MIIYNKLKNQYEAEGYTPFVLIVKWTPDQEKAFLKRWSELYDKPEGKGVKGIHTWNLIGRNTLFFTGWMNSPVSLQKLVTWITYGTTGVSIDVCPAIDHFGLNTALRQLKSRFPDIPVPKTPPTRGRRSKAKG